ncbi:MAG: hypothetical protein D6736_15115, partial [Nitrospinota bacterium]
MTAIPEKKSRERGGFDFDTHPEAEQVQIALLRQTPPWRKLDLVGQLNHTLRILAFSGLHQRYPHATGEELQRRFVDLWLGTTWTQRLSEREGTKKEKSVLPPEPLTVILLVIDVLEALGIPYLIGGSLASAVYGVPRATLDADLVADIRLEQAEPLAQAWRDVFYVDVDAIRDAVRRQSSFNLIHLDTLFKV